MTGEWPVVEIDHRDQNGLNNCWANLRLADKSQNSANRGANRNNRIGLKGVSKQGKRYRATIQVRGHWQQIGVFDTPELAHAAYAAAASRLCGEFASSS